MPYIVLEHWNEKIRYFFNYTVSKNNLLTSIINGGYDIPNLKTFANRLQASLIIYGMESKFSSFSKWINYNNDPIQNLMKININPLEAKRTNPHINITNQYITKDIPTTPILFQQFATNSDPINLSNLIQPEIIKYKYKNQQVDKKSNTWKTVFNNKERLFILSKKQQNWDTKLKNIINTLKYTATSYLNLDRAFTWFIDFANSKIRFFYNENKTKNSKYLICGDHFNNIHLLYCQFTEEIKEEIRFTNLSKKANAWKIISMHTAWIKHLDMKHGTSKNYSYYKSLAFGIFSKIKKRTNKIKNINTKKQIFNHQQTISAKKDKIIIFIDGSKTKTGTGMGLVAKHNNNIYLFSAKLPNETSNNTAEYMAALLAVKLIEYINPQGSSTLFTDSQITIQRLKLLNKNNNSLNCRHIYSHLGIWGNEIADLLAKQMTQDLPSPNQWILTINLINKCNLTKKVPTHLLKSIINLLI